MTSSSAFDTDRPPPDGASVVFQPGSVIHGKYRIERAIAQGGMGIVVLATQLQLDRRVAIKYLRPHALSVPGLIERFEREARLAAKIKSEHVVRVHDVGVLDGCGPYMVMEYLEGHDLGRFVARGALPIDQAVDYVIQACDALAEAHVLGIVHRDLKPENLFLADRAPRAPIVKIIDFGISKIAPKRGESGTWTNAEDDLGTPSYMSPEQLGTGSAVDARSDIWALGIVLHELLTGARPFDGPTIEEVCTNIITKPPIRLDEVLPNAPPELTTIVLRCLEKDPARRFESVARLTQALAPFGRRELDESAAEIANIVATASHPPGPVDPRRVAPTMVVKKKGRPGPLPFVAVGLALAGLSLVMYFGVIRTRAPDPIAIETSPVDERSGAPPSSAGAVDDPPGATAPSSAPSDSKTAPPSRRTRGRSTTAPPSKDPHAQFGERK